MTRRLVLRCIGIILVLGLYSAGQGQELTVSQHWGTRAQWRWTATVIPNLEMAVVYGDPAAKGSFVLRLRAEKQVRIPPHWHPADEHLTVLTGTPALGMGDRFVAAALRHLHTGDYVFLPGGSRHFALFEAGTEVQLHGDGPFITHWVDPGTIKALQKKDVDSNSERSKMKAEQEKH